MLAFAIVALLILSGMIAVLVIADSLVEARAAYARLMREGEVMRAGFALQTAAVPMQPRPAALRSAMPRRRHPRTQSPRLQACAAA